MKRNGPDTRHHPPPGRPSARPRTARYRASALVNNVKAVPVARGTQNVPPLPPSLPFGLGFPGSLCPDSSSSSSRYRESVITTTGICFEEEKAPLKIKIKNRFLYLLQSRINVFVTSPGGLKHAVSWPAALYSGNPAAR